MSQLFSPLRLRGLEFKNRIFVSPMCQYSSVEGVPNDWHLVHLGSRAVGGAACVIQEATAVSPDGRISPHDAGIWNDAQVDGYRRITRFIKANGAIPGIQLAHAGRKASTAVPWLDNGAVNEDAGGWRPVWAPSPLAFSPAYVTPQSLTVDHIASVVAQFGAAAQRSLDAGFELVELHLAHGYLLHEFLSPFANQRTDEYGGNLKNRMKFALQVAETVRKIWPENLPILARISATDWKAGGWDITQSVALCQELKAIGVDLVDASTGGVVPDAAIPVGPGYQVTFAETIRRETGIATGAVGLITTAAQAENIIASGQADIVLLARELLRDPYWPLHAAHALGVDTPWPNQYKAAKAGLV